MNTEVCYINSFTKEPVKEEVDAAEYKIESVPKTISFLMKDDHLNPRLVRTYFNVQYVRKI